MDPETRPMTKRQRRELKKQKKVEGRARAARHTKIVRILVWVFAILVIGAVWYLGFMNADKDSAAQNGVTENPSLGTEGAPVVITEYSDFGCSACAAAAPTVKKLIEEYPDQIQIVFNGFNLQYRWSEKSHEAGECAFEQNKFWEFHDVIFRKQSEWASADDAVDKFKTYAAEIGLDGDQFANCLDSGEMIGEVDRDTAAARGKQINSTPTFFINGQEFKGAQPLEEFKKVIDAELEKANP